MNKTDDKIILTLRESLKLLEWLQNPQPRNAKFNQAMARYQSLTKQNKHQS